MLGRYPVCKRVFDFLSAVILLLTFLPVFCIVALMVRVKLGSPIVFVQKRIGLNETEFRIYKFRTMNNAVGSDGKLLPDEERLTSFGRFLRATSLDELPQLWCVLSGELSLVGPRPLLPEYLERYSETQRMRHLVMPGITGWAQINGRNDTTWEDRLAKDVWYVKNWSFLLDLKILLLTIVRVWKRSGINAKGSATMPEFTGSEK
jgi:lipopolysaccharide/colanic/teichoic acid biosynthesis glycosyltransferase